MQPVRPQVQRAPSIFTTTWPISAGRAAAHPGLAVEDDPAAHAGAPPDSEQRPVAAPRAQRELAVDRHLHVVPERDRAAQRAPRARSASGNASSQSGRLRAPATMPASASTAPGEPTPTSRPARPSPRPPPRRPRACASTIFSTTAGGPALLGGGQLRLAERPCRAAPTTTAWILVPPRSMPPFMVMTLSGREQWHDAVRRDRHLVVRPEHPVGVVLGLDLLEAREGVLVERERRGRRHVDEVEVAPARPTRAPAPRAPSSRAPWPPRRPRGRWRSPPSRWRTRRRGRRWRRRSPARAPSHRPGGAPAPTPAGCRNRRRRRPRGHPRPRPGARPAGRRRRPPGTGSSGSPLRALRPGAGIVAERVQHRLARAPASGRISSAPSDSGPAYAAVTSTIGVPRSGSGTSGSGGSVRKRTHARHLVGQVARPVEVGRGSPRRRGRPARRSSRRTTSVSG